jgi:hypothetical protein
MNDSNDWMKKEYGIPHKNGMVRFYLIGFGEDVYEYLGWFDMTDWDKGWEKVTEAANSTLSATQGNDFQILRHDQILDLWRNVSWAIEEALQDKDETTTGWWFRKQKEQEAKQ